MKIKTLAVAATAFLHLKGPDGAHLYDEDKPVGIDLYGPGSSQFSQVEERQSARAIARMRDNNNQVSLAPIEERRAQGADDLAALTAGFRNLDYDGPDGKPLSGSALFTAVYADPTLGWIKEQVSRFVGDWGKFKPVSPTS